LIFFIFAIHVVGRDMPGTQLLWRHASPLFDVKALTAFNAEQTLRLACHCADTLVHGIDKMDARYNSLVGTRHAFTIGRVLRLTQTLPEATVAFGTG